jgi:hypothetical protein
MSELPVPDVPASRTIGRASVAALLAVAAEAPCAVLESVWHRSHAAAELGNLPGNLVEVACRCDPAIAAERYARRAGTRAAGHFDAKRTIEELWNDDVARPVAGGWPVLEVDTTARVDVTSLVGADPGGRGSSPGQAVHPRLSSVRESVCLARRCSPQSSSLGHHFL